MGNPHSTQEVGEGGKPVFPSVLLFLISTSSSGEFNVQRWPSWGMATSQLTGIFLPKLPPRTRLPCELVFRGWSLLWRWLLQVLMAADNMDFARNSYKTVWALNTYYVQGSMVHAWRLKKSGGGALDFFFPLINKPRQGAAFIITDEPTTAHHQHPEPTLIRARCCAAKGSDAQGHTSTIRGVKGSYRVVPLP